MDYEVWASGYGAHGRFFSGARKFSVVLVVLFIAGCANLPRTPEEIVAANVGTASECSSMKPAEASDYLAKQLENCLALKSYLPITMQLFRWSEVEELPGGGSLFRVKEKANWNEYTNQVIYVQPGDTCETTIEVFSKQPRFQRQANRIAAWFGDEPESCD